MNLHQRVVEKKGKNIINITPVRIPYSTRTSSEDTVLKILLAGLYFVKSGQLRVLIKKILLKMTIYYKLFSRLLICSV